MTTKTSILEYITKNHVGAENAILAGRLCSMLGITGRLLRRAITELQVEGYPVCSDTNGYFYAVNEAEIENTIIHLSSRAQEMETARDGLLKAKANFMAADK
jgi:hypothetical protein